MIKHRSLAQLILLSLCTCGIYGLVFWQGYIKDINDACVCDGKKSPGILVVILLSVVTCGLYFMYWLYVQGERLRAIAPEYGLEFKESGGNVLMYYIGGSVVMGISSSVSTAISLVTGVAASLGMDPSFAGFLSHDTFETIQSLATPLMVSFLTFCCFSLYVLSLCLTFKSLSILIQNLNTIAKVYNAKCV